MEFYLIYLNRYYQWIKRHRKKTIRINYVNSMNEHISDLFLFNIWEWLQPNHIFFMILRHSENKIITVLSVKSQMKVFPCLTNDTVYLFHCCDWKFILKRWGQVWTYTWGLNEQLGKGGVNSTPQICIGKIGLARHQFNALGSPFKTLYENSHYDKLFSQLNILSSLEYLNYCQDKWKKRKINNFCFKWKTFKVSEH